MLNNPQGTVGRKRVARLRIKAGIERHIVIGRVEARVIEDVEELRALVEGKALGDFGVLFEVADYEGAG